MFGKNYCESNETWNRKLTHLKVERFHFSPSRLIINNSRCDSFNITEPLDVLHFNVVHLSKGFDLSFKGVLNIQNVFSL